MPNRAPSGCGHPGCANPALPGGRCSQHYRPPSWSAGARGKDHPPRWQSTRRRVLLRDAHTCQRCGALATEVDHVVRGGGEHDANLQALCSRCHHDKTEAEAAQARSMAR